MRYICIIVILLLISGCAATVSEFVKLDEPYEKNWLGNEIKYEEVPLFKMRGKASWKIEKTDHGKFEGDGRSDPLELLPEKVGVQNK